ncbi:hypothetical protein H310_12233 [Aphanomyces invadans]|uniref:Uncharacterized protein n=1 Tax=Aphanomyces invadans TaxID=157072 RepID=A0A024TIN2_9STRA|nr:hypothetical protein H310_12233 [Aphanomyces invadans]ETV93888.1 hypothetical protein H310_12233 [Aphanomyces invadans]|eukprot:XP_008877448.1 hypothetical protein H310_12233 [Aphanomyces invadans]
MLPLFEKSVAIQPLYLAHGQPHHGGFVADEQASDLEEYRRFQREENPDLPYDELEAFAPSTSSTQKCPQLAQHTGR